MAKITEAELEELDMEFFLERESVAFRLGRGVSGVQLNIQTCPNPSCRDNRWRTYFGLETGRGNCFVCGEGFSKLRFIHDQLGHENWGDTFRAIEEILREQGWRPKRQAMVKVEIGEINLPISDPIPDETGANIDYLAQRGIPSEIAKYFELRNCTYGWWRFKDENGDWKMQTFSNRIIIPVFDLDGTIKTFQGRDVLGTSDRKYLFPKELPGTGRYILNGHNCLASQRACMGEGFFDVAAIKIAFDEDVSLRDVTALGSFGKHLSYGDPAGNDQLGRFHALKMRGLREVTIMWDGEVNALKAALDAAKKLNSLGLLVRIALLPFEKDPNEITADQVRRAFYGAKPWTPQLDMTWRLQNPYSTPALRQKHGL
jgi:DNA primase